MMEYNRIVNLEKQWKAKWKNVKIWNMCMYIIGDVLNICLGKVGKNMHILNQKTTVCLSFR